MRFATRLLAGTALGVLVTAGSFAAQAAESGAAPAPSSDAAAASSNQVEEIIVTAQKRSERNLDVPINITAYSGDYLEKLGITDFSTLSSYTPGLIVQEQSPNNPGFVIRGLTSDSGESNVEPRVSVYQDGVSISRSRGSVVELFDMERVEVLKGPQSTLFGRGALIGAINLVENKAEDDTYVKGTVGFGSFQERNATAIVNAPIVEGKLFARIAATYTEHDGYVDGVSAPGTAGAAKFNGKETVAVRGSLHFDASADTNFDLIANYQHDTPDPTGFKSGTIPAYQGDTSPYSYASLNDFGNFEGGHLKIDRTVWGVTLLSSSKLNDAFTLSGTTAFRKIDSTEVFDADGSAFDLLEAAEYVKDTQASQEVRLNYEQGRVKSFIGANFFYEDGSQRVPLATNERDLALWYAMNGVSGFSSIWSALGTYGLQSSVTSAFATGNPSLLSSAEALLSYGGVGGYHSEEYTNFSTTRSFDSFGDVSVEVVKDLTLTGGLRWSYDDKTTGYEGHYVNGASTLSPSTGTILVGNTPYQSASGEFSAFTWRALASYAVSPDANIYASYARGRRPQVITPVTSSGVFEGFATLKDETVDSYEVGAKTRLFDGKLGLEGSVYRYKYNNYQTTKTTASGFDVLTVGKATSYGVELQSSLKATDWMQLIGTYSWSHGRFDDDALSDYAGKQFRLSPDQSFSVVADMRWPFFDGQAFLTPNYVWKSKVYFEETNEEAYSQDGFGLFNLRAGWITPNKAWTFTVFANNILDKDYLIDAGNSGDSIGSGTYISGAPRTLGVSTSVQF